MAARYDFTEVEEGIARYWNDHNIHAKANKANTGKKSFYFLDGPPYTSGRVHIGTAWNKSLKDMVLRYKRMRGYDVWDRAGYDMHGMPTEQGTEKELGLKNKDEIYKLGIDKFVSACKEFSLKNMKLMNRDFTRLGVWMDFEGAYKPVSNEYIEGEWWLIKQAHEKGRLYEGEKTMTWCAKCGTALAKHELEYKQVTDDSIFLKFPIVGKESEFLIIWTTTPWTIPFNLGVMVNPTLQYVRAKVGSEVWIVAKGLAGVFISGVADEKFEILEEFFGDKLEGTRYVHPLQKELKDAFGEVRKGAKNPEKMHTVVLSEEYVDLSAGTGLVHMAPGCGPEDYEVGYREGIPPFNELSEQGVYSGKMGKFAGFVAKRDDKKFIEAFKETGLLVASTKVDHDYAHCWRCKSPVVYRTTTQWFFKIEDLKDKMRELNKEIYWVPDFAGSRNFDSWLANLRDNGITRQRFWGTPLPVWKCEKCGQYDVIGSLKELEEKAGFMPKELHKPWIDEVKWKCPCGGDKIRSPDILDVWIDSGSASWNCLFYPQRKDLFDKMFPADFIMEGIDQIRGWFNLLLVASMVSMEKPSFKKVYMHGFVQDSQGRKMSKSLGNYILPEEVISKYGADTLRYYMIGGASPGVDINYNFEDMTIKNRNMNIFWNLKNYLIDMGASNGFKPANMANLKESELKSLAVEDRYILSKANSLLKKATERMDGYYLNEMPGYAEELFMELSRTYVQLIRDRAALGDEKDKKLVFDVIYDVFLKALRMFSIVAPFMSERMYLDLKEGFGLAPESIFLMGWAEHDERMIDEELESMFETSKSIVQSTLNLREQVQLGQRWPLKELIVVVSRADNEAKEGKAAKDDEKDIIRMIDVMGETIKTQTNVKQVRLSQKAPEGENFVESAFRNLRIFLDKQQDRELLSEGYAREMMRRVQNLRKKANLTKKDEIKLCIISDDEAIAQMLGSWKKEISAKVGAKELDICGKLECKIYSTASTEKIRGIEIGLCLEKA